MIKLTTIPTKRRNKVESNGSESFAEVTTTGRPPAALKSHFSIGRPTSQIILTILNPASKSETTGIISGMTRLYAADLKIYTLGYFLTILSVHMGQGKPWNIQLDFFSENFIFALFFADFWWKKMHICSLNRFLTALPHIDFAQTSLYDSWGSNLLITWKKFMNWATTEEF